MKLTQYSSPAEVRTYHPKRDEWDEKMLDPNYKPVNPAMTGCLNAQDNVVMRRHIREFFPGFADIVNVCEMDRGQLEATIHRLSTESMNQI